MAHKRIAWSEYEQDILYIEAKKLWESTSGKDETLVGLIRLAQIALPEGRRRKFLVTASNIPGSLRAKMVENGIGLVRGDVIWKKELTGDQLRIQQLADERDQAFQDRDTAREEVRQLKAELSAYRNQPKPPTESETVKNFLADVLYLAEAKQRAINKPDLKVTPTPPWSPSDGPHPDTYTGSTSVPQTEAGKIPAQAANGNEDRSSSRLPKIVLVGGEQHHGTIHAELKSLAQMRFVATGGSGHDDHIGERLKAFKDPLHGRVVLWTNLTSHQAKRSMQYHNIPFTEWSGSKGATILKLKDLAKKLAASTSH